MSVNFDPSHKQAISGAEYPDSGENAFLQTDSQKELGALLSNGSLRPPTANPRKGMERVGAQVTDDSQEAGVEGTLVRTNRFVQGRLLVRPLNAKEIQDKKENSPPSSPEIVVTVPSNTPVRLSNGQS